jgi:predicted DNA-binding helix-hairpin-helix protein
MFYNRSMDSFEKLALIGQYMHFEPAEEVGNASTQPPADCPGLMAEPAPATRPAAPKGPCKPADLPISHAQLPNGKSMPLLKTLLTSACERNCFYCAFRAGRDFRRTTFTPDELGQTYMKLYRSGVAQGIFLSSGVAGGGVRTQDQLIDTAEVLRCRLGYQGYLHLKIMPGAERAQVERAMQLADRVSINLEAPSTERLTRLAPQKVFLEELLTPLRWIEEIRRSQPAYLGWKGRWPSSVTQFVAGGAGENDLELLQVSEFLHRKLRLARVYFSGFSPVPDTPLEGQAAINPWRTHRLYQSDFLLRDYGFGVEDLQFLKDGNLPVDVDPKLAWARVNLGDQPVEINHADLHELLRIPGIGPRGAHAIMAARRQHGDIRHIEELKALGVVVKRAAPFIQMDGHRAPTQMALF